MESFDDFFNRNGRGRGGGKPEYYEDTHNKQGDYTGAKESVTPYAYKGDKAAPEREFSTDTARSYRSVIVYAPKSPEDVQSLIDFLRRREPAIINLDTADSLDAQRILDFVSGAIYALNGSVHRIASNIFLLSPEGVEITIPYDYK